MSDEIIGQDAGQAITEAAASATGLSIMSPELGTLVTIDLKDGTLTYGPKYSPDLAARAFWNAWSTDYQAFLRWQAEAEVRKNAAKAALEVAGLLLPPATYQVLQDWAAGQ